ncbi:3-mercaptopyruvate sulfurtransferase [Kordiimonas aquimaris]|uniref:3-mercaptopyruvate sulfurtransferase n=1 Tax=Kordiimonas aquimaris TaxID=707591 RepID=UPI0021D307B6|nr:3-mercaptopyruvate sulfurtransferase [Kordiimonas aquimaris]
MERTGIISAQSLLEINSHTGIKIYDASWHMPDSGRNGHREYMEGHIPYAHFFDIDAISDPESTLPHTMPQTAAFEQHMQKIGINNNDHIIIYDNSPLRSAARAWWMLRYMDHKNVSVLDGGLQAWKAVGGNIETTTPIIKTGDFKARPNVDLLRLITEMLSNLESNVSQVIDARAAARFEGTTPEPRAGLAAGHIPGAINVPFTQLYNGNGTLKTRQELIDIFKAAGVDINASITTSCGSGVTACNLAHALYTLGNKNVAVYDGSWSEWGAYKNAPVSKGL